MTLPPLPFSSKTNINFPIFTLHPLCHNHPDELGFVPLHLIPLSLNIIPIIKLTTGLMEVCSFRSCPFSIRTTKPLSKIIPHPYIFTSFPQNHTTVIIQNHTNSFHLSLFISSPKSSPVTKLTTGWTGICPSSNSTSFLKITPTIELATGLTEVCSPTPYLFPLNQTKTFFLPSFILSPKITPTPFIFSVHTMPQITSDNKRHTMNGVFCPFHPSSRKSHHILQNHTNSQGVEEGRYFLRN